MHLTETVDIRYQEEKIQKTKFKEKLFFKFVMDVVGNFLP
jgi:hypothetical protein